MTFRGPISSLPPGQQTILWSNTWIETGNNFPPLPPVTTNPNIFQMDWPNPQPVDWRNSWTVRSEILLIGQDQLPVRQQNWPNPQVSYWYDYTWIETGNNFPPLPNVNLPKILSSYASPLPITWYSSQTTSFPLYLIGKDKLPIRQQDWPNPVQPQPVLTWNVLLNTIRIPPPPVVTDLHFRPFITSVGRLGHLGGLS